METLTQRQNLNSLGCEQLKGVGPHLCQRLAKLGIVTIADLLFHLPYSYQDRTRITPLANIRLGHTVLVEADIIHAQVQFGRRRSLVLTLANKRSMLTVRFFHFNQQQQKQLCVGMRIRCFGEVRRGPKGFEMVHPEYRMLCDSSPLPVATTLTPVYPATEHVSQHRLRQLMFQALSLLQESTLPELLPATILSQYNYPSLKHALLFVHAPPPDADIASLTMGTHLMQQRLILEELLAHHLSMRVLRERMRAKKGISLAIEGTLQKIFLMRCGFALTDAQTRVWEEILNDLQKPAPMSRLLQGDVGCGKTVIAALAMLQAVSNGYQAVLMAPTEILAEQHYRYFVEQMEPLGVRVVCLLGKQTKSQRSETLTALAEGEAQLIIGTHALFQEGVEFNNIALIIIDEQHRFGVHQRLALHAKGQKAGKCPHQLVMSATPIPRTLSMVFYADLDISIIDQLPPGRTPIKTVVVGEQKRDAIIERVRGACELGAQVYWVCPLIEESDSLQCQAAEVTKEQLQKSLPGLSIGLVHGRMKPSEKETIMAQFKQDTLHVLVATTVIEVGVDVPNASLMIIENAERLGLSQLHQLRGRVGRGAKASFCVLMYKSPLGRVARERLNLMRETSDGFKIAEFDLEQRGAGELLGKRQTGQMQFRLADLVRDKALLPTVKAIATQLLEQNPKQAPLIMQRWLGNRVQYAVV